jgi:hypothetical protein
MLMQCRNSTIHQSHSQLISSGLPIRELIASVKRRSSLLIRLAVLTSAVTEELEKYLHEAMSADGEQRHPETAGIADRKLFRRISLQSLWA